MSDITDKAEEAGKEFAHRMATSLARCEASPELQKKHGKKLDALRVLWEKNARAPLAAKQAVLEELRQLNRQIEHEAMFP